MMLRVTLKAVLHSALTDASSSALASIGGGGAIASASLLDGRLDAITVVALFMIMVGLNEWSVRRGFRVHEETEAAAQKMMLEQAAAGFTHEVGLLRQTWERVMADSEGKYSLVESTIRESRAYREQVGNKIEAIAQDVETLKTRLNQIRPL